MSDIPAENLALVTCTPIAIYRHRLLMLEKALFEAPHPEEFDMSLVIHDCGTPGCAFGHYVYRTDLQDAFAPQQVRGFWFPVFKGTDRAAVYFEREVREHFGLSLDEQKGLFSSCGCAGAKTAVDAAAFVAQFVDCKYPQWLPRQQP